MIKFILFRQNNFYCFFYFFHHIQCCLLDNGSFYDKMKSQDNEFLNSLNTVYILLMIIQSGQKLFKFGFILTETYSQHICLFIKYCVNKIQTRPYNYKGIYSTQVEKSYNSQKYLKRSIGFIII